MDVYRYKREVVEIKFDPPEVPQVLSALTAVDTVMQREHQAVVDRTNKFLDTAFIWPIGGLLLPTVYRNADNARAYLRIRDTINEGDMRVCGHDAGMALQFITFGFARLATIREEPLNKYLSTIKYHQIPKL